MDTAIEQPTMLGALRAEAMSFLIDVQTALMKITPPPHRWVRVDTSTEKATFEMFDQMEPDVIVGAVSVELISGSEDPNADGGTGIKVSAVMRTTDSGMETVFEAVPRNGTSMLYRFNADDLIEI